VRNRDVETDSMVCRCSAYFLGDALGSETGGAELQG
jgi:hypothetical protein